MPRCAAVVGSSTPSPDTADQDDAGQRHGAGLDRQAWTQRGEGLGVPKVRQRDSGQAMATALPITSEVGTVLLTGSQWAPGPVAPQW